MSSYFAALCGPRWSVPERHVNSGVDKTSQEIFYVEQSERNPFALRAYLVELER
jgi:hypothetical protein